MMYEIFANFQKYDEKGRRVNLFAQQENGKLTISYFLCSKQDQFSKARGWVMYLNYLNSLIGPNHPGHAAVPKVTQVIIDVVDNKPKKTFLNWCNDNFYHLRDRTVRYNRFYLENKQGKRIILKDKPMFDKLSMY
jgi:hypothetical protein